MTKDVSRLHPATPIKGSEEGDFWGRAGLLVFDAGVHDLVVITAAQIGNTAGDLEANGVTIARSSLNRFPFERGQRVRQATSMLALLPAKGSVTLSEKLPWKAANFTYGSHRISPERYLGAEVLVHVSTHQPRKARVVSTHARFRMPCPFDGEITLFTGAIELESLDTEPVTSRGDAGALVTSVDGDPFGVVVCGIGNTSFAAPLKAVLEEQLPEWELLGPKRVAKFNQRAKQERVKLGVPVKDGLQATGAAELTRLQHVLESEDADQILSFSGEIASAYFGE